MLSEDSMQPHKKFAFDVGITFIASVITLPFGFVITVVLGRYLGAGDLGLYRMASTIYGIAMLVAAIGIPAAIIKNLSFCGALPHDPASPVRAYKKALPKKQYSLYTTKYVAEFKDDRTKFNQIVSSGIITSLFLAISGLISFIACISLCFMGHG